MSLPMPAHNTADLDTAGEILMVDIEAHSLRSRHTAATLLWSWCHSCAHIRFSSLVSNCA